MMALEILERLESICHGARIRQLFDYVVGVSTGAIICAMVAGLDLSIRECKQIYRLFPSRVFQQSKVAGSLGLLLSHSYYDTDNFLVLLRQICGEKTLLDTSTDLFPKVNLACRF
ncbi:unnamed protein product [Soboliphyme baturini]|uniref:PNPLA domain-containing protein n=1 Tax=Soboliphyme baturini TaxID=241478 RepID=A0A183J6F3_9BILA|nr:unnamed protein product [Soboliphyme baturini]